MSGCSTWVPIVLTCYDILLTTFGVHAEFNNNSNLWIGAVLPLTDGDNRFFDSELQLQFNRRF